MDFVRILKNDKFMDKLDLCTVPFTAFCKKEGYRREKKSLENFDHSHKFFSNTFVHPGGGT